MVDTDVYKWLSNDVNGIDTPVGQDNGGAFWGSDGAPVCTNSGGCCLTLQSKNGSSPLFFSENCMKELRFICTINMP